MITGFKTTPPPRCTRCTRCSVAKGSRFNSAVRRKLTRERHVRRLSGLEAAQLGAGAVGARALLHAVPVHGLLIALRAVHATRGAQEQRGEKRETQ